MKCKHCDGDGVIVDVEYGHAGKYGCKYCDGKGVVEPLTNEEWLRQCTTEQLARWIVKIVDCDYCPVKQTKCKNNVPCIAQIEKWLKQSRTKE